MTETASLDPANWDDFRRSAHQALDAALDHMNTRAEQPVWTKTPPDVRTSLQAKLPRLGTDPDQIIARMTQDFLPYATGNTHARFFGWVHGAGTPDGVIPEMFAAAMNSNLGGRDHVANEVEKQVIDWCRQMFSFPDEARGLIVSGTSMATIIALKSARDKHSQATIGKTGISPDETLTGYASSEAHSCIAGAFDMLGLGKDALRSIPVDADFRMDIGALRAAIAADRAAGLTPFCVVGTAGSVNVGSIDPLDDIADICAENQLWFHVDGAFGSLAILSPLLKPRVKGIERAASIAFDFHKWLHVNYDAGFVLVRNGEDQRRAFSDRPEYLEGATRGLAAGNPWFCEYGPELSRGARALKVWYHLNRFGLDRLGEKIAENCDQAVFLAELVDADPRLERLAPIGLNITCFRYAPDGVDEPALDQINGDIVVALQESGRAAPSTTRIDGKLAIRVNITNHRTRKHDLTALITDILNIGVDLTT